MSVISARTVTVGVYNNPPKISVGKDNRPRGIFIDILEYIAAKENWQLEYRYDSWPDLIEKLENDRIDIMPDVAYSAERARLYEFNKVPVISSWLHIYIRKNDNIESLRDLHHRTVAVLKNSIQHRKIRELAEQADIDITLQLQPDYRSTIDAVENREADAVILGRFYDFSKNRSVQLKPMPVVLNPSSLHFVTLRGENRSIIAAIDRHMSKLLNRADSVYYRSLEKWLNRKPERVISARILLLFKIIAVAALISLILNFILNRKLSAGNRKLREKNRELSQTVSENETLHKELLHRTRNNMQVIISMLTIQVMNSDSAAEKKQLQSAIEKIQAMSLVHERLYLSDDLSRLSLRTYINDLVAMISGTHSYGRDSISFELSVQDFTVLVDIALPVGLLLYELVSNSLYHAFTDKETGRITVELRRSEGSIIISYSDDGKGVSDDFNFSDEAHLGLNTIATLVEGQLQGSLEFDGREGFKCTITFPEKIYADRLEELRTAGGRS